VVVGLGLNLWWPEPSEGAGALHEADPGEALHAELGALWAAELLRLVDLPGWPVDEYRKMCVTLGKEVAWEPEGSGRAVDVTGEGELVVDGPRGRSIVRSGAVRHLRDSPT
jgi:biotin-(acetyl-CoA carboxylase) ligase